MAQTIAVLGATGRTGKLVVERALARGMTVRALARTPSKLGDLAARVEVVEGDASSEAAVATLVAGVDAVVSTLGTASMTEGGLHVATMPVLMRAMKAAGVKRYLALSSSAAVLPGDRPTLVLRALLGVASVLARRYIADKAAEVRALRDHDLEWTLVRPGGRLVDGPDGELRCDLERASTGSTTRAAAATLIVRALADGLWIRCAPYVCGP